MNGSHVLKAWSTTQSTIAMSSAEAEYYALVEGAVRGLGLQSMTQQMWIPKKLVLFTDSSAAKSFSSQRGLSRMRHMDVKNLWLQEAVCRNRLKIERVNGKENPADLFTKYLNYQEAEEQCSRMSIELVR